MSIRVIIVDKNKSFSRLLETILQSHTEVEVVSSAFANNIKEKISNLQPDIVIYDIDMQTQSDEDFIKQAMKSHRIPFIFVSKKNDSVSESLKAGAVDFISKPSLKNKKTAQQFVAELISKIITASGSKSIKSTKPASNIKVTKVAKVKVDKKNVRLEKKAFKSQVNPNEVFDKEIIAIGASTGGTEAVFSVLNQLPNNVPGIVIVQHIPPVFSGMFANRLNDHTPFNAKEAENGEEVKKGHVYLAPGDKHMQLKKRNNKYFVEVYKGEKVGGHCPSVNVLFDSVASVAGDKSLGVILTGMGKDGATGLLNMRKNGAFTIGQDEESSIVYGMPKVAFDIGAVCRQSSLDSMGYNILKQLK